MCLAVLLAGADAVAELGTPDQAHLAAADACRLRAQYGRALEYYEKALGKRRNTVALRPP